MSVYDGACHNQQCVSVALFAQIIDYVCSTDSTLYYMLMFVVYTTCNACYKLHIRDYNGRSSCGISRGETTSVRCGRASPRYDHLCGHCPDLGGGGYDLGRTRRCANRPPPRTPRHTGPDRRGRTRDRRRCASQRSIPVASASPRRCDGSRPLLSPPPSWERAAQSRPAAGVRPPSPLLVCGDTPPGPSARGDDAHGRPAASAPPPSPPPGRRAPGAPRGAPPLPAPRRAATPSRGASISRRTSASAARASAAAPPAASRRRLAAAAAAAASIRAASASRSRSASRAASAAALPRRSAASCALSARASSSLQAAQKRRAPALERGRVVVVVVPRFRAVAAVPAREGRDLLRLPGEAPVSFRPAALAARRTTDGRPPRSLLASPRPRSVAADRRGEDGACRAARCIPRATSAARDHASSPTAQVSGGSFREPEFLRRAETFRRNLKLSG